MSMNLLSTRASNNHLDARYRLAYTSSYKNPVFLNQEMRHS